MSFLDTLKNLGLWQGQQAEQPNPYGLDPAMMAQARMSALGNVGGQLLALSQQMTPDQRARMMANADWTGGYQDNLMNAAQMQILGETRQEKALERERREKARGMVADMIRKTPQGRLRDAAMYFFEAGDLPKAGEILFAQERRFDPMTGGDVTVDYFGNPVGGGAMPSPGGAETETDMAPASTGGTSPIPAPASVGVAAAADEPVDQLTTNWRALLRDPTLTPVEARTIASQGSQKGAYDAYQEVLKNRQTLAKDQATQSQTALSNNRSAAGALTDEFTANTKSYDTIISAGQRAVQVAQDPSLGAAAKLTTLYQYMKALDPDGAVREGDVDMAQQMQGLLDRVGQQVESAINGGGPISGQMINDMAREMARLANDAMGRKDRKRMEMVRLGRGRQIPDAMIDPTLGSENQNMLMPIGYKTGGGGIAQPQVIRQNGRAVVMPPVGVPSAAPPVRPPPATTPEVQQDLQRWLPGVFGGGN